MDDMRYAAIGGRLTLCTYQFKGACNHLTVSNQLMFKFLHNLIESNSIPIEYRVQTVYIRRRYYTCICAWPSTTRVPTLPPNSPFNATKPS